MRAQLVAGTPTLRVHVLQREQEWVEEFSAAIAARMNLDQANDLRPELAAAMIDQALAFIGNGLGVDTV